jgi:hypothetical protein
MAATMFMGLNVDMMIAEFGLLSFFSFFQDWLIYGLLFFVALMITENFQIWFLKRRVNHAENDRDDLIIRVNDLRRQINELKTSKKTDKGE